MRDLIKRAGLLGRSGQGLLLAAVLLLGVVAYFFVDATGVMKHEPPHALSHSPQARALAGEPSLITPQIPQVELQGPGPVAAGPELALPPPEPQVAPSGGSAAVYRHVATDQKVVFVTIDDGWVRDPRVLELIRSTHLPVSLFLLERPASEGLQYFRELQAAGATIEDHTVDHRRLTRLGYRQVVEEVCPPVKDYQRLFGATPVLFRPPYGAYNATTLKAAATCGFPGVVLWDGEMTNGVLRLDFGDLRPGDIILLHFRTDLYDNLVHLVDLLRARGFGVGRLESYLAGAAPPEPPTPSSPPEPSQPMQAAAPGGDKLRVQASGVWEESGEGSDHAGEARLAFDANPATAWHTSSYTSGDFGGLKQGLGLWFDLGAATGLRDIEVLSLAGGWSGALRFSDDARNWSPPGPIEKVGADHVFPAEGAHRYWMIWITKLTTTPGLGSPSDPYTVGIREVEPYPG